MDAEMQRVRDNAVQRAKVAAYDHAGRVAAVRERIAAATNKDLARVPKPGVRINVGNLRRFLTELAESEPARVTEWLDNAGVPQA